MHSDPYYKRRLPNQSFSALRQGAVYFCALLLVRVLQLLTIGWFTGGTEFSDDVHFYRVYAADPLQLLLGHSTTYDVFPPLFPIVLWSIHTPLSWILSPFYSMRMSVCLIELLAWPLLWWIITSTATGRKRHLLAIAYIVAPVCWVCPVIMSQDEVVSLFVFAAVVVALLKNRTRLAILLCGIGVVFAKIYFLVPLVGLLGVKTDRKWRDWLQDALVGLTPIAAVYGLQAVLVGRAGVATEAFANFVIPYQMTVNIWAVIHRLDVINDEQARRMSAVIALALSLLPLLMIRLRAKPVGAREQVQVVVAMLLWVYASFFHINPEYYLIVVPGVLFVFRPIVASLIMVVGFSLPWAVNFFYGVGIGIAHGDAGRAPFVRVYQAITSIDPSIMQGISAILAEAVTLLLASILTWKRFGTATRALA